MAGRYDDQERYYRERERERYDDRYDVFGLNDERERWSGSENRAFDRGSDRSAPRDRVFGERESGVGYNEPRQPGGYRNTYGGDRAHQRDAGWQDPDYDGVSPAARRGDYDVGYRERPYAGRPYASQERGGRYYGDDGRDYGRGYDGEGRRFGSYDADRRWEREMRRPAGAAYHYRTRETYSGGTGGYDYERGYGDGGRSDGRHEGFEDRARDAGEFLRRTGQKISNWFADATTDTAYDRTDRPESHRETYRGARGLGPKGYKRSDERVSDDVHQRLADDPWLDASNVNVAVSGGEVTLSGTVESREAKHRAERIVEDLSGVYHVQNNLRVHADSYTTSSGDSGRAYGANTGAAIDQSPREVKDVTDGNTTPPAQKRN